MANARVKWLEKLQFVGTDSTNHSVVMSSQDEQNGVGMKPSELLLVALGGCTAVDVVTILNKKRQRLTSFEVEVSGTQTPEPPWTFTHIHLAFRFRGRDLRQKAVDDAVKLSKDKYCSVSASLAPTTQVTHDIIIEEDE